MPSWRNIAVWAAAAVLTMAFIGPRFGVGARFGRELSQSSHRLYSFGAKAYRESERIIDELNVLRMAVGVAFEDRLDILNEKLRDLEQAQQPSDDPSEQSRRTGPSAIVSGPKPIRSTL